MIKVSVDEAYAYDMLAILTVKEEAAPSDESAINRESLWIDILLEVGGDIHAAVMASPEYQRMIEVNQQLFSTIDALKVPMLARDAGADIDRLNYQRYLAKRALQEKFFPNTPLTERKVGYTQGDKSS